jgi:transcriptional regulator with GAF, ATPase, and Fis domain
LDLLTPLSKTAGELAGSAPTDQDVFLLEDPQAFPVSREMTEFHGLASTSVILLVLRVGGDALGYLVLISEGEDKFVDEHLDWVRMLKEPFVIAMANALKHKQVLKLNDLLADEKHQL